MGTSRNFLLACGLMLAGSSAQADDLPAITPVPNVDLPRFMGDWYVIATIPSWFEKDAWNPVETYRLEPDGRIDILYRYRKGGFDGARKEIASTGFVTPGTGNAVWGVQLLWPIKAQYLITYVNDDHNRARQARLCLGYGKDAHDSPDGLRRAGGAGPGSALPDGPPAQSATGWQTLNRCYRAPSAYPR